MSGGKLECFRFSKNNKVVVKHYTEITEPIRGAGGFQIIDPLGGGEFKLYVFKSNLNSKEVQDYMKKLPSYSGEYDTQLVMDLYSKYGRRTETISIFNSKARSKFTSDFGLSICPNTEGTPNISPGSGKQTNTIRTFKVSSSTFHIDINYKALLCYGSIKDTISRGKAKLWLYRGNTLVDTILSIDFNDEGSLTKTYEGMTLGDYKLVMELEDTYQDSKEIYFEVKSRIRETKSNVGGTGVRDDSKYSFYVTNSQGKKVDLDGQLDIILDCNGTCQKCIRIVVPKGETYTIHGDFYKPDKVTTGGPSGTGSELELTEGVVKYDVITRKFPPGKPIKGGTGGSSGVLPPEINLPIPDWGIGGPVVEIPTEGDPSERTDPFFWADVIKIETRTPTELDEGAVGSVIEENVCYPLGTQIHLDVEGISYNEFMDANPQLDIDSIYEDEIELNLKNPSNSDITINLDFIVDDNFELCGGGGEIKYYGGGFEFWGYDRIVGEDIEDIIETSSLTVDIEEYLPNHEVIGGCNGSYVDVLVKKGGGTVKSYRVNDGETKTLSFGNLFDYGDSDFDIEVVTHQMGVVDPRGYDIRSTFLIEKFQLDTRFELNSVNFDSQLDFYINGDLKFTSSVTGSDEHYFDVKKGLNRYKFVFSTNHYDYNWDYVEIPWIRLTNWICGEHVVTPYCDEGGGDKCVEALIGCLLGVLPKKGCITINYYDKDTRELLKKETRYGFTQGYHTIKSPIVNDYIVVGDTERVVFVNDSHKCTEVNFYYRRTYRRCVYVYHIDKESGVLLKKEHFKNLVEGSHTYSPIIIPNFKVVDGTTDVEFITKNTLTPEECHGIYFYYDFIGDKNPYLDCLYIIHHEYGNHANIFETEYKFNLHEGKLVVYAKEFEGYRVVGDSFKEIDIRAITDLLDCLVVDFEYELIPKDCIIVQFVDRVNGWVLDTDYYYDLLPNEYIFNAREFEGYQLVSKESHTILITEEGITDECKEVKFFYEPMIKGCNIGKRIWLFT